MFAKKLLTVTLSLCAIFLFLSFLPVHGEEEIYESVVRLHVLANSDSEEDQALKLKVRDGILEYTSQLVADVENVPDAEKILYLNLDAIKEKASAIVRSEGFDQSVSVEIGRESYPTRKYGALSFPAGNYLSLKIMIGDATGQNWWCVLFPPLCLSAAEDTDDAISVGFTGEEYKIITHTDEPTYKIRFKILETIEEAIGN